MNVLIACEFSGVVREAFRAQGHNAWSCDLLPAEDGSIFHYTGDVRTLLPDGRWDLMIAHPPCTFLANSEVRWLYQKDTWALVPERWAGMRAAAAFFADLLRADIPRVAIENPIIHKYAKEIIGANQSQIVQPWQFGHGEVKATCLWLKNLPRLTPTNIVSGRVARVHRASPGPNRWKERSRTLQGIACAMAEQWGSCG